jgi:uncharacterized glyoxalase superfamily protein PhnB
MKVNPIPEGFHTVTPYLVVKGAAKLIDFLKKAFNAKEIDSFKRPDGTIMHATVQIGDSRIMLAEATEKFPPVPASLYLYVTDTDAMFHSGMEAGGTSLMEPADQFYGDRNAGVKDPTGNSWWIATHVEDVSPEEMQKRSEAYASQAQAN